MDISLSAGETKLNPRITVSSSLDKGLISLNSPASAPLVQSSLDGGRGRRTEYARAVHPSDDGAHRGPAPAQHLPRLRAHLA